MLLALLVQPRHRPIVSCAEPQDFRSRSTAKVEEARFAEGSDERRIRLNAALEKIGFDPAALEDDPEFRGSAALRMYTSFVLPKSSGALASAERPQRAATIASSIAFLVREMRAAKQDWLRNHDRALKEVASLPARHPMTLVLDNVRSAANVGNIFRAAEAARIDHIVLCGITPAPPDAKVLKTALGAAQYVPFSAAPNTLQVVKDLQARGVAVYGVETTELSTAHWATPMPQPVALVFGNELIGIDTEVLRQCDELVCVPVHGVKNSLNIATCASVLMWEALRQWTASSGE